MGYEIFFLTSLVKCYASLCSDQLDVDLYKWKKQKQKGCSKKKVDKCEN